jgi:hypothetical protein
MNVFFTLFLKFCINDPRLSQKRLNRKSGGFKNSKNKWKSFRLIHPLKLSIVMQNPLSIFASIMAKKDRSQKKQDRAALETHRPQKLLGWLTSGKNTLL